MESWQSGRGLVGGPDNSLYFMTGNIDEDEARTGRLGNSFVKLQASCGPNLALTQAAVFEPANSATLSKGDTDLGSSGPILIDDVIIGGGKQGRAYVLNSSDLTLHQNATNQDGFQGFQAGVNILHNDSTHQACTNLTIHAGSIVRTTPDSGNSDRYCRDPNTIRPGQRGYDWPDQPYAPGCYLPRSCYQLVQQYGPNIHEGFVYWPADPSYGLLYLLAEKDHLRSFKYVYSSKQVVESPVAVSDFGVPEGMPGAALSVSADHMENGLVWVSMPTQADATLGVHRGSLLAADAKSLKVLWRDNCINYFAKFNPPIIADGKVVLATFADPASTAVPGTNCSASDPSLATNPATLASGTAWLIVYGLH